MPASNLLGNLALESVLNYRYVISPKVIENATGLRTNFNGAFTRIGDLAANHGNKIVSYIKDIKYLDAVEANQNLCGIFCTEAIAEKTDGRLIKILTDDPTRCFFSLLDYLRVHHVEYLPTIIKSNYDQSAAIHISDEGIYIGENVIIEPNVTILPGTIIENNVIIRAGAVIGVDGFQHQRTKSGIISPRHDGVVWIRENAEIGANSSISTGFSYRSTIIGRNTKLDSLTYVAHGAQIGDEVLICTGCCIMGHAKIGDMVWIGPNATVSSRVSIEPHAKVSLGSVVTKDIESGQTVSGNFAIDHQQFLKNLKNF